MAVLPATREDMHGSVVLSHGFESGPDAVKTLALARVAEARGWQTRRMDYRDLDRAGFAASVAPRIARLRAAAGEMPVPCVFAGSSMGAFVSGIVSRSVPCAGLFLLSLPLAIPGTAEAFAIAEDIPLAMVHGFDDTLCPHLPVVEFARRHRARLVLVADDHRLGCHVDAIADEFARFLDHVPGAPR